MHSPAPTPSPLARVREALTVLEQFHKARAVTTRDTVNVSHATMWEVAHDALKAIESLTAHSEAVAALVEAASAVLENADLVDAATAARKPHSCYIGEIPRADLRLALSRLAALEDGA